MDFPYKSLHDYLDSVFKDKMPSETEIKEAKKDYWRSYNTHLKRTQRAKYKEVTLALDKQLLEVLLKKRKPKQSLHDYIKELLTQIGNDLNIPTKPLQNTTQVEQQLFLVIDYLEGLVYQRRMIDKESITGLENLLHHLQQLLDEKF